MPDQPEPKRAIQLEPPAAEHARQRNAPRYAELHCLTNFSFLEGASHPDELVARAAELGYAALAITDRHTLAGVVRAHGAAKQVGLKLLIGAEIAPLDAPPVILWATDRAAYGRLARLITRGRRNAPKGECRLTFADLAEHATGLLAGVLLERSIVAAATGRDSSVAEVSDLGVGSSSASSVAGLSEAGSSVVGAGGPDPSCLPAEASTSGSPTSLTSATDEDRPQRGRLQKTDEDRPHRGRLQKTEDADALIPSPRYSGERARVRGDAAVDHPTAASPEGQPAPPPSSGLRPPSPRNGEKDPEDRPHRGRLQIYDPDSLGQLLRYRQLFGDRCYLLVELHHGSDDERHFERCLDISRRAGIPLAAAGGVLFHDPERRPLCDVLTATRVRQTVAAAAELLEPNAERYLKSPAQLGELFAAAPACLERTLEIAARCTFSLDELRYEYPEELAPPGRTPLEHLEQLTWQGARMRYPAEIPAKVQQLLKHELAIIADLRYEAYFLTVWDLVRFARQREILCQGRGSAANSAVCYCLGVTAVDPERMDVLFERFISRERNEAPDIDVDFEHERREEVLQYLYDKYGRDRVGMTAEVITYRPRSAVRDVGKALGLSLDRIDALAKVIDSYHADKLADRCRQAGVDPESPLGRQLLTLVGQLLGFPRHLGQHVGGMVMTQGPLCELVPIENAAMADRTVIEWDKDDLDELGILKVDCLSLGMLTAIRKCFDLVRRHHGRTLTLADVPEGDPATYEMISRADTMGVFQIESRAQMSMLPRLRPNCFYDLVVEVAIVRPGPIQGNMVHPYLRRRAGLEPITYPNDEIREVLHKTLGVPLFQEQAMRLAVVAAGFTPGEADQLRRAMGAWRRPGIIEQFKQKLTEGMLARGLAPEFAHHVFNQIRGFGEYGFPESHAASFALLAYVSAWLKCHYPAAFCAALLNSQPMGFYAPAQLVRNAREHGVEILPVDVNDSLWDATLENGALRLGLRQVVGLGEAAARQIEAARGVSSVTEVCNPGRSSSVAEANGLGSSSVAGLSEAGSSVGGVCAPDPSCLPAEASRLGQSPADVELTGGSPTSLTSATEEDRPQRGRLQKTDEDRPRRGQLQEDPSSGLRPPSARDIGEKGCARFISLEDFSRRTGLARAVIARLARADAFGSLTLDRRQSMWQALAHEKRAQEQPLLAGLGDDEPLPPLPAMTGRDEVFADYQTIGLSLRAHPVSFFRPQLDKLRVVPAARLADLAHGRFVRVAGLVLVRQRPSTAKGITFVTLEDETGTTNLIVRMDVWERFHLPARTASAMLAMGRLQKQKDVIHVLVSRIENLAGKLGEMKPRSRDFH